MNNTKLVLKKDEDEEEMVESTNVRMQFTVEEQKAYSSILLVPGSVVSLSRLVVKGKFKNINIGNATGRATAGKHLFNMLAKKKLGQIIQFHVHKNSSYVSL